MTARRTRPMRRERRRGLVVTEGRVTEPEYVYRLKQELPRTTDAVDVKSVGVGKDPMTVLAKALELRNKAREQGKPYDWVCCLVDVDQHATLPECLMSASTTSVEIVVSNPRFELWLLWHLEDLYAHVTGRDLDRRLDARSDLVSGKHLASGFPIAAYPTALTRARRADPEAATRRIGPNPSSAMSVLLGLMLPES